jgi:hypothetical protein
VNIARPLARLAISLIGAVLPIFFLSGSYSPLSAYLPNIPNLFGNESALYNSLQSSFGTSLPVGVLPFGAAGITGIAVYGVLQRLLRTLNAATYSRPNIDPSKVFESLRSQMMNMNIQRTVQNIPQDMSKTQYLILSQYRNGRRNSKNIAKTLSLDKQSVEEQTRTLQSNGYLTKDNKLTTKGLETVS